MTSVQIKGVPDNVHAELRRRAALNGRSLQEYLLAWLIDETSRPTIDEVLNRVADRNGWSVRPNEAAALVRLDRDADNSGR